jgi:hypothetical protein
MYGKKLSLFVVIVVALPGLAFAEMNTDLRVKFGSSAQADELTIDGVTGTGTGESSSNFQVELIFSPKTQASVGFIFGAGLFARKHSGSDNDPIVPVTLDYKAAGLSLTGGIGIKANANLHFEGKLELGLGSGEPTMSSPGFVFNSTDSGSYSSVSFIVGGYYTVSSPGFQIGLELGTQTFEGDFKIWNNGGFWSDGTVEGSSGTVNLVLGYRF